MDAKVLGSFIAAHRKENHMTQAELAKKIHVTDKAVSRWERGLGFPDINTIEPLADALGIRSDACGKRRDRDCKLVWCKKELEQRNIQIFIFTAFVAFGRGGFYRHIFHILRGIYKTAFSGLLYIFCTVYACGGCYYYMAGGTECEKRKDQLEIGDFYNCCDFAING